MTDETKDSVAENSETETLQSSKGKLLNVVFRVEKFPRTLTLIRFIFAVLNLSNFVLITKGSYL